MGAEGVTATLTYCCGGCSVEITVDSIRLKSEFSYLGNWRHKHMPALDIEALAPEGWVASDPYTACTYCPDCWAGIEGEQEERE